MLRLLVLILILSNGVYFAWSEGMLQPYGFAPNQQRELQRLAQQVNPEALRVLTSSEAKRTEAMVVTDLAHKECLQAGPFDDAQAGVLRTALEATLAPGTWQLQMTQVPARWIVYMGKFSSAQALEKKREELAAMRLVPQALSNPDLEIGLSLAGFDSQADAQAELSRLNLRGIRTAKVVQERPEGQQTVLKLPALTSDMKAHLTELKPALSGRSLKACT